LIHRNNRDGTFDEVSKESGIAALPLKSRRGAAFGDIFNNGNVDAVLLNVGEPLSLLLNCNKDKSHRVLFNLVGTKSNRAAIGSRVTIRAAGGSQIAEVRGGGSYLSQNDLRIHSGLGAAAKIDSVEIRWPSGKIEKLENVTADAIYTIVEGAGILDSKVLPPPGTPVTIGARQSRAGIAGTHSNGLLERSQTLQPTPELAPARLNKVSQKLAMSSKVFQVKMLR
jgi:enediyne biosynthesis protein E4